MKRTKSAFTLIELLVVIAIIGMLLAIIMPGLKKAKDAGRTVVCAAQLKQFGLAWYFYAQDNDDSNLWYAPASEWPKGKFWFYQLAAYFGDTEFAQGKGDSISGVMKIMRCPSTTAWKDAYGDGFGYGTSTQAWQWTNLDPTTQSKLHEGSYTLNGWMQDRSNNTDNRFYRKYTQAPATVPLLTDGGWVDAWPVPENAQKSSTLMDLHGAGYPGEQWRMGTPLPRIVLDRHNMAINVLHKGHHISKVRIEKLWNLPWHDNFEKTAKLELPSKSK